MRTPRGLVVALLLCVVALAALAVALERRARRPAKISAELDVAEALGGGLGKDDERFARATAPREFVFPADHGAHDGFRTEWWYVTGNLFAADGRAFGVQLTFFRNAQ